MNFIPSVFRYKKQALEKSYTAFSKTIPQFFLKMLIPKDTGSNLLRCLSYYFGKQIHLLCTALSILHNPVIPKQFLFCASKRF